MTKRIDNLQKMVLYFLRENPALRNDDIALQLALVKHKYPASFRTSQIDGKEYVAISALYSFTQDNVKRVRAKIQNEMGLYLPTDEAVRKARKIKEEEWRKWLEKESQPVQYWNDTH